MGRMLKKLARGFRASCGKFIEDAWSTSSSKTLKASIEFDLRWPLHEIKCSGVSKHLIIQKRVADFESSCFDVPDDSGFRLFLHVPSFGTETAAKMKTWLAEENQGTVVLNNTGSA
jgi:hypothetical protein